MRNKQRYCRQLQNMFGSRISAGATEKLPGLEKLDSNISTWSFDLEGHAKKCVERFCELANKTTQHKECPQIVLKYLYLARIGRPDIPWSVNKLAR